MATLELREDGALLELYRFWDIPSEEVSARNCKYLPTDFSEGVLTLPEGITALGDYCLREEDELVAVIFPSTVRRVESGAFRFCKNLKKVVFNEGLEIIKDEAFCGCGALTEITLPSTVIEVGKKAFAACGVKDISLPEGVKKVGDGAFAHCNYLEKVYFPATLRELGEGVFNDCPRLKEINSTDCFVYEDGVLRDRNGGKVLFVASTYIPEGTKVIGDYAYAGVADKIKNLVIPNSVKRIGACAFDGADGITSLYLPDGLKKVGDRAFRDCVRLEKVTLHSGMKLGERAFEHCRNLREITLGNIEILPSGIFSGCEALEEIHFSEGTKRIGSNAFRSCRALKKVVFPDSLAYIGESAFEGCSKLEEVVFGRSKITLARWVFENCFALKKVNIPNTAESIEVSTFVDCRNLDACVEEGGKYFTKEGCIVERESGRLIYGNNECRIPEGVKIIEDGTYTGRKFKEIYLPSTLKSVGFYAFDECKDIDIVYYAGTLKDWTEINFHEDEYWSLQANGDHEEDGVPNWYFARSHIRLVCTDGEGEVYLY